MHKTIASAAGGEHVLLDPHVALAIEKEWQANRVIANKQAKLNARKKEYGSAEEQLNLLYDDAMNGTTKWKDKITDVKARIPLDS